jgi:hypothetical protein
MITWEWDHFNLGDFYIKFFADTSEINFLALEIKIVEVKWLQSLSLVLVVHKIILRASQVTKKIP